MYFNNPNSPDYQENVKCENDFCESPALGYYHQCFECQKEDEIKIAKLAARNTHIAQVVLFDGNIFKIIDWDEWDNEENKVMDLVEFIDKTGEIQTPAFEVK